MVVKLSGWPEKFRARFFKGRSAPNLFLLRVYAIRLVACARPGRIGRPFVVGGCGSISVIAVMVTA